MDQKQSRVAVVSLTFIGLLVAYPLSLGPATYVAYIAENRWDIVAIDAVVNTIYSPLFSLPELIAANIGDWRGFWSQLAEPTRHAEGT